jgi:hypothetical protein
LALSVAVPNVALPLLKVMVPVATPPNCPLMFADKVTVCP